MMSKNRDGSYLFPSSYTGKLVLDEKGNSDWLPEESEFCNTDREDRPVTKQGIEQESKYSKNLTEVAC